MTIIFFTRLFFPHIGGVEKHVLEISKILIKKRFRIIVFAEQDDKELKLKENIHGIEIYRISVGCDDWFKKFRIWWQLWQYRKIIKQADIVHAHDVFFWYLPFRFFYPKKPIFVTFHGYETKYPASKKAIFMHKLAEKLSNGNICVGDYLKKWYGTKADFVTYGGVNIDKIRNKFKTQNSKIKIVFIGRLEEDMGISIYLKALEILKNRKIDFEFEACGDGSLKKEVVQYGLVHGLVEDLSACLKRANLVFASSYLSILEAIVWKRLVLAVFDNPLKEDYLKLAPFAKWIVIENSAEKLAEKIEYFIKHFKEKEVIIDGGYEWARQQTWQKTTNLYKKLWANV